MVRVAIIGEAMLELSSADGKPVIGGTVALGYGGDTLNTAVYMARLGVRADFVTALGRDPYSDALISAWRAEGVGVDLVARHPRRGPGLYAVETDADGERHFYYWRGESAARAFFDLPGAEGALVEASHADFLYLSGVTLSLFDEVGREALVQTARTVRAHGGEVAFDPNFRAKGWPSPEVARAAMARFCEHVTIALPTLDDEFALHGAAAPEAHARRWLDGGAREVIIKRGSYGCDLFVGERSGVRAPVASRGDVVDSTGAGDSFNGAYLAARVRGWAPAEAAAAANALAAEVVRHPGAIIPRAAMPEIEGLS